ncbi:major facilitator superfamily domain-containing protein [Lactarius quietus]|nr:major facilitator superfamily domain-containing protein [Lactarius quietus]
MESESKISLPSSSFDDDDTYETDVSDQEAAALLAQQNTGDLQYPDTVVPYSRTRVFCVRAIALLCACSLSIGSHYGIYILAPLKSRLEREMGTSDVEFSLLISAFSLNSTWTPLLGGVLTSRLGTTTFSIIATSIILSGLSVLLVGDVIEDVKLMTLGMFVFGLGISPLSVVQETIIVKFFKSQGLGVPMALGLVVGKAASYLSAHTSYPLSERFGPHAPFYMAVFLAAVSFGVNLLYVSIAKWLVSEVEAEPEASDHTAKLPSSSAQKTPPLKGVKLHHLAELGDVFWAYIGVNFLCGAVWNPFSQLAANILERRFGLTEQEAGYQASFLLAGSIVLYPLVGFTIDKLKRPYLIFLLFFSSSLLTLFAYFWLVLPPGTTKTAWPAILCFATGTGYSSLLLVVLVPRLVQTQYISTALGAHKSLEQTGTVISQTLAGLILDKGKEESTTTSSTDRRDQLLLRTFLVTNGIQLCGILLLWHLKRRRDLSTRRRGFLRSLSRGPDAVETTDGDVNAYEDEGPIPLEQFRSGSPEADGATRSLSSEEPIPVGTAELSSRRRGMFFGGVCALLVAAAWILFLVTAWLRLRSKSERG